MALTVSLSRSNGARNGTEEKPRLLHLQILRFVAASLVIVDHSILTLDNNRLPIGPYYYVAWNIGLLGVLAFFALSGLIMVRQSAERFSTPGASSVFLLHRVLRVVPMYWIATACLIVSKYVWHVQTPHLKPQVLLSLSFLPNFLDPQGYMQPLLQQGWTLNYEMLFYAVFALCLLFRRRTALRLLVGLMVAPVLSRSILDHVYKGHLPWFLAFYTDWYLLLFVGGVLIGAAELPLGRLRRIRTPLSPALLLLLLPVVLLAFPTTFLHTSLLRLMCLVSCVVVVLCTLVNPSHPGIVNRAMVLLGDASYSTYLFHGWIFGWLLPPTLRVYEHFHKSLQSPWIFIAMCLVAGNVLGLLVHLIVERPLMRALRRIQWPGSHSVSPGGR